MKKVSLFTKTGKFVCLLIVTIFSANSYAQQSDFTFKRSGGGGLTAVFDMAGGYGWGSYGEFAFLLRNKGGLQIINHIIGQGGSIVVNGNTYGIGSITQKISFGGFLSPKIRTYGFVQGGIGVGGSNETIALNLSFGGGGGMDLFVHRRISIYFEAGYLQHHLGHKLIGGMSASIGIRSWF